MRAAEKTTMDPAVMAAAASVAVSWYYFFVKGNKQRGLFTGMWAPTILAFGSYFEQTRMGRMMEHVMGREGITAKVQRMMEEAQA